MSDWIFSWKFFNKFLTLMLKKKKRPLFYIFASFICGVQNVPIKKKGSVKKTEVNAGKTRFWLGETYVYNIQIKVNVPESITKPG